MPNIDVSISADLQGFLQIPPCSALQLPNPQPLKVSLPGGATLGAFSDLSKGILLASIQGLVKVLKLIQTVVDLIGSVKLVGDLLGALPKIVDAAHEVVTFAAAFASPVVFARDLLCLIIKVLNCLLGQLQGIADSLGRITVKIGEAQAAGNVELLATLQCARDNVLIQAGQLTASFEPVGVILDLAGALLSLAGVPAIKLPSLGATTDVDSLNQVIQTLQGVVTTLQKAAEPLGGCQ
jgi:hypothetical protein